VSQAFGSPPGPSTLLLRVRSRGQNVVEAGGRGVHTQASRSVPPCPRPCGRGHTTVTNQRASTFSQWARALGANAETSLRSASPLTLRRAFGTSQPDAGNSSRSVGLDAELQTTETYLHKIESAEKTAAAAALAIPLARRWHVQPGTRGLSGNACRTDSAQLSGWQSPRFRDGPSGPYGA
jgi:hypothetical protein